MNGTFCNILVFWYVGPEETRGERAATTTNWWKKENHYFAVLKFLRGSKRVLSDPWDELPQFGVTV